MLAILSPPPFSLNNFQDWSYHLSRLQFLLGCEGFLTSVSSAPSLLIIETHTLHPKGSSPVSPHRPKLGVRKINHRANKRPASFAPPHATYFSFWARWKLDTACDSGTSNCPLPQIPDLSGLYSHWYLLKSLSYLYNMEKSKTKQTQASHSHTFIPSHAWCWRGISKM